VIRAHDADIAIVGAGASGLSLAWRLVQRPRPGNSRAPRIVLIEPPPGPEGNGDRTWCFWEEPGGEWDELVTASWTRLLVRGHDGRLMNEATPRPYKMLRSADLCRAIDERLAREARVRRVSGTVSSVADAPGSGGGMVYGKDAGGRALELSARWVFDSRPPGPGGLPPARTTLLQHFRGWFVTTAADLFDPAVAELMDFRTPQPPAGLSFAYVLPLSAREALVEYTEFSPAPLTGEEYDAALRHYTSAVRPLGDFTVTGTETGVIPMTDGVFPRRLGATVFPLGAAAGAIRPSTGYAFAAIQRQTAAIAAAYHAGRTPQPPRAHSRRHRAMDAVLLRALATGRVDGAEFFTRLFHSNPLPRVLRFLDGRSGLAEEWALGLRAPVGPMLRSLAELPLLPRTSAPALPEPHAVREPPAAPRTRTGT
jgi:lycopene beta-cyclase